VRSDRPAATGRYSNVTVNLTAGEAVALEPLLMDVWTSDPAAVAAIGKLLAAAERARVPWSER
jgi:hypothetical protein